MVERFQPEFEKLLLLTLMLPWGQDEATEASEATEAAEPSRGPA